ncbi:PaaI family thioesterase [Rhodovulum sp. DZ06]|uniref:PaaI family thioesterase n=1 Tax=Rhodovulum sp. DZ06 TaxID=3425126 RepID=UPI003D342D98
MRDLPDDLDWRLLTDNGFTDHLGPTWFAKLSEDEYVFRLEVEQKHINAGGVCHGGVSLSLLDNGMGGAAWEAGGRKPCATIELDSHFLAAAKLGQTLEGWAKVLRCTSGLAFMEGGLSAGGRETMRARGVWKYLDIGK